MILGALALVAVLGVLVVSIAYGMRRPFRVLALYAAIVPFGSGIVVHSPLPSSLSTASSLLGLFATGCLALQVFLTRQRSPRLLSAMPVWLLLAGLSACTYFWSVNPSATAQQVLALAALVALFVFALLAHADAHDLHWFEGAVIAGGAATGAYAIGLLLLGRLTTSTDTVPRFATAGGAGAPDPNITAASLLLPLMLAVSWALSRRSPRVRLIAGAAAAATLTGILLTGSRGGLIAAVLGCLVLAGTSKRAITALAVVALAAAVAVFITPNNVRARLTSSESTGRENVWQVGLRACSTYCIAGSGAETFPDVYAATLFTNPDLVAHGTENYKAHNLWLAFLVEEGVAGVALGAIAFALVFADLRRVADRRRRAAPAAAVVALLASNVFLNNFAFKYFWLVLIYAGMVALVHGRSDADRAPTAAGTLDADRDRQLLGV